MAFRLVVAPQHFFCSVLRTSPRSFREKFSNIFRKKSRGAEGTKEKCPEGATKQHAKVSFCGKVAIIGANAIGPKMKHIHHIIPVSQGGSDDPENLVELDFVEHARIHALDFLAGGPDFDFRHSGWIFLEEDLQLRVREEKSRRQRGNPGNFGGGEHTWTGRTGMKWWNDGWVAKRSEECPGPGWVEGQLPSTNKKKGRPGVPKTEEWKEKMREKRRGDKNPCAGRRWVTDGKTNIYLKPGEETPENFTPGRTL